MKRQISTVLLFSQYPLVNFVFRLSSNCIQLPFAFAADRTLSVNLGKYLELLYIFIYYTIAGKTLKSLALQIIYSVYLKFSQEAYTFKKENNGYLKKSRER